MKSFNLVIVIGYGTVTRTVLSRVYELSDKYKYDVIYIEHEVYPFNLAKKYAEIKGIEYIVLEKKEAVTCYLEKKLERYYALIISASNNYIFPKEIVECKNCTIINFHNALLPDLPGRNAPSWAIYKGYDKTGITWHYVTSGIDEGDIIKQQECSIEDDMKAYELVAKQMRLAGETFEECFEKVLCGEISSVKQPQIENRKTYKSEEVPADGFFSLEDDPRKIYRLLRSMDYGKTNVFPYPKTVYHGKSILIKRYKVISKRNKVEDNNKIYLPMQEEQLLMLKYDMDINEEGGII